MLRVGLGVRVLGHTDGDSE